MVFDKVKKIIVDQLDVEEDKVTEAASITDDLGADSLDVVDLVMSFEEEFDIEIPDDQVEKSRLSATSLSSSKKRLKTDLHLALAHQPYLLNADTAYFSFYR